MATDLFTPILNDRTRAPHFFNGRLLTGEAMGAEQKAQQAAHELLAQGLGDGVAWGLDVLVSTALNTVDTPIVTVTAGAAISRRGDLLFLKEDTDLQLVRPTTASAATQKKIFNTCVPPQQGTYVTDAGVYLLTIAPITVGDQLAPVSGLGESGSCNVKYRVNAVEFRLIELEVHSDVLSNADRMRNRIAYACFGVDTSGAFVRDPFGDADDPDSPLDRVGDCEVPLAVMYWSATGGIGFVDIWSVRRRLTKSKSATDFPFFADARLATAEAMVLQFRDHLRRLADTASALDTLEARTYFRWLPPAGLVPIAASSGTSGFSVDAFFSGKTWNRHVGWPSPIFMEAGGVEALVRVAIAYPPVDLQDPEMVWVYWVHENMRALHTGDDVTPYALFANANVPFFGDARLDRAHFGYSNLV